MKADSPSKRTKYNNITRYLLPSIHIKDKVQNRLTKEYKDNTNGHSEELDGNCKMKLDFNSIKRYNTIVIYRKRLYPEDEYMCSLLSQLSRKKKKLDERNSFYSFKAPTQENSSEKKEYLGDLMRVMEKTNWSKYDRLFYLISYDWFKQECINPSNITTNHLNSSTTIIKDKTISYSQNPIHNLSLVIDSKEYNQNYYLQGKEELILKELIEEGKDYQLVTQDIWNYLHSIYGGNAVRITSIPLGVNGELKKDIKVLKVN